MLEDYKVAFYSMFSGRDFTLDAITRMSAAEVALHSLDVGSTSPLHPTLYRLYTGSMPALYRLYTRLYIGSIPALCWLYIGSIPALYWLYNGSILTL